MRKTVHLLLVLASKKHAQTNKQTHVAHIWNKWVTWRQLDTNEDDCSYLHSGMLFTRFLCYSLTNAHQTEITAASLLDSTPSYNPLNVCRDYFEMWRHPFHKWKITCETNNLIESSYFCCSGNVDRMSPLSKPQPGT